MDNVSTRIFLTRSPYLAIFLLTTMTTTRPIILPLVHACGGNKLLWWHLLLITFGPIYFFHHVLQLERDMIAWNNKRYAIKPLLVREDELILKHRRWFSQFYSENSPRFSFKKEDLSFWGTDLTGALVWQIHVHICMFIIYTTQLPLEEYPSALCCG